MGMYDVIIIGSGVMGMSIARGLSQTFANIAVIDRDEAGKHASYKAGGMLGAQNEFTENSALFRLATTSQRMFEPLRDSLFEEVGVDIEYLNSGLIKLATDHYDNKKIEQQYQFLRQHFTSVERLSPTDVQHLSNETITSKHTNGIYMPEDNQINANRYTKALLKSLSHRHIDRIYQTTVTNIESEKGGYRVETQSGTYYTEKLIVTGGAWTSKLLRQYLPCEAVSGVKGEVLLIEQPDLNLDVTMFLTNGCYVVPKLKNRYLVGATSYFDDYSVGVSNSGKAWLKSQALHYIPDLKNGKIINQWSGIRPYCQNEQPIMDEVDKDLFVIAGHYRNGILLSPLIGELMSQWIISGHRPKQLYDFQNRRGERNEM